MTTSITLRATKGSELTHNEVDANFSNLKTTADAAMVLAGDETVTGIKTFADGKLKLAGSSSGALILAAPAVAGSGTVTLPASGTVAVLGTAQDFTAAQTMQLDNIGATTTDGLILENATAAAAGAQQWSPRLRLTGQGWKTTATAASQRVDWVIENVPVQGAAAPTTDLVFSASIAGGAYVEKMSINSGGILELNGISGTPSVAGRVHIGFSGGGDNMFIVCQTGGGFAFSSSTQASGTPDIFLKRTAAATLRQGAADAAAPIAQTLEAQGSRAGTDSNVGGASYTIQSGTGTGTGTTSSLILKSPVAVASGSGAQTQTTGLTIKDGAACLTAYTVGTLPAAPPTGACAYVTDSNAASYTAGIGSVVAAGGTTIVPVFFNGTNWLIG